ncbi:hypothetical protein DFH07DRAFT_952887 [Mycena maculata]|uniref:Peroxidase n=1 Tax=Mycena maculata TaxID=230809 RepID=A0AAD7NS46_9AGAR|nr:hypothetical protein DFH07DRAFT_952887 [Mycena maculata]
MAKGGRNSLPRDDNYRQSSRFKGEDQAFTTKMLALTVLTSLATASVYMWLSSALDERESARFNQQGFSSIGLINLVQPYNIFLFDGSGPKVYQDMATHNITDGTGGLDGSIRFPEEQARPEVCSFIKRQVNMTSFRNAGDGFNNTLLAANFLVDRYGSLADSLLQPSGHRKLASLPLSAQTALFGSRGPVIHFRGGRIDAGERRAPAAGFSHTEMIGLAACGSGSTTNTEDVAQFDMTFVTFDNNVATEYVNGTTQNPLLVGFNDTTNSDERIFESGGNVTMSSFANSLDLYTSTCTDLFAAMLNTVPSGVQLTDVITPLPKIKTIKPP